MVWNTRWKYIREEMTRIKKRQIQLQFLPIFILLANIISNYYFRFFLFNLI